jgi:hypothetical protein
MEKEEEYLYKRALKLQEECRKRREEVVSFLRSKYFDFNSFECEIGNYIIFYHVRLKKRLNILEEDSYFERVTLDFDFEGKATLEFYKDSRKKDEFVSVNLKNIPSRKDKSKKYIPFKRNWNYKKYKANRKQRRPIMNFKCYKYHIDYLDKIPNRSKFINEAISYFKLFKEYDREKILISFLNKDFNLYHTKKVMKGIRRLIKREEWRGNRFYSTDNPEITFRCNKENVSYLKKLARRQGKAKFINEAINIKILQEEMLKSNDCMIVLRRYKMLLSFLLKDNFFKSNIIIRKFQERKNMENPPYAPRTPHHPPKNK